MDQTWKVFSDFRQTDNQKHNEDCLPLYRNLYVVIQSIPQKKNHYTFYICVLKLMFFVEVDCIFVCMYTHGCIHTHTHSQSTPDVMPEFFISSP